MNKDLCLYLFLTSLIIGNNFIFLNNFKALIYSFLYVHYLSPVIFGCVVSEPKNIDPLVVFDCERLIISDGIVVNTGVLELLGLPTVAVTGSTTVNELWILMVALHKNIKSI